MARLQGLLQANKMQADTIDDLRAQVARLEGANAVKDAALKKLCTRTGETCRQLGAGYVQCVACAALSDTAGEGKKSCPNCRGSGTYDDETCVYCDGSATDPYPAGEGTKPQFVCNCNCHYTSEACCPECTARRGEGWPEVRERMIRAGERVWEHYGLASWAIYEGKREEAETAREFRAALDSLNVVK